MTYSLFGLLSLCWPWFSGPPSNSIMDDLDLYHRQKDDFDDMDERYQRYRDAFSKRIPYQPHVMSPSRNFGPIQIH